MLSCRATVEPLDFEAWVALPEAASVPEKSGVYRFRNPSSDVVGYIGETGTGRVTLAKRLSVLRSTHAEVMPYRYPYAAAPALWALRHAAGRPLEVSWVALAGDAKTRRGRWALELARHRQRYGSSPPVNFGRMPFGYRSSSSYSCALIHSGGLYRGGPSSTDANDAQHAPGRPPLGRLDRDVHARDWCGGTWSAWNSNPASLPVEGVVRARRPGHAMLVGLVQGKLAAIIQRLRADGRRVELSWMSMETWPSHHREEILTDLLGAHVLHHGRLPG